MGGRVGGGGWLDFKFPAIASFSGVVGIVAFIYGFTEAFVAGFLTMSTSIHPHLNSHFLKDGAKNH